MEYTSVVAPPRSTAINSPRDWLSRVRAASTAAGVGINMPEISRLALVRPLAATMRRRNTSRITFWQGSMFNWLKVGITFWQGMTSCPPWARACSHARLAARLPASTMGKQGAMPASILALWITQSWLPPSVPPHSRKMSGFRA